FGITLATGLVVDDAIVVIENIERHIQEGETNARKASSAAMKEVTGAVIATSLVLVAVFVPVAFFPGTTGILFRQFALTIAFSISISAFNALTLTPSLSALLLGRVHGEKGWFFRGVDKTISGITHGYESALRGFLKLRLVAVILFFLGLGFTYFIFQKVPKGFVPNEDLGYFIIALQAPPGASLEYTKNVGEQAAVVLRKEPEIRNIFFIRGFSLSGSAPNRGIIFCTLQPYSKREGEQHTADAVIQRVRGPLLGISGALVLPFPPPAVQGLGTFGGFQYELQDQGGHSLEELAQAAQKLTLAGNQLPDKSLAGLYSSFTANDPQFLVTIDRDKAKSLHVPLQQITDTLGVYMGSAYVNDFD
ncbi:MAG: efflux RND transporter permease subunit, partial [Candidatus Angelobacter sp.]